MKRTLKTVDVAVVGSGPGGATIASSLAERGKNVLLLEKGRDLRRIGNHFSALFMADRMGLKFTEEGTNVVRALVTGGSTIMYCGAATEPPVWLKSKYGLDLDSYTKQTIEELNLEPLPDERVGAAGLRIMEAGNELGYGFQKLRKFINPEKCRMRCGGTCMLGCPYGAKWSAREYIRKLKSHGGELISRADVQDVQTEDGVATGLTALVPGGVLEVTAKTIIVAAGGLGTPAILQRTGISEAGRGLFLDPLVMVSGISKFKGTCQGPPMTVGTYDFAEEGILLSDLIDPWLMWPMMTVLRRPDKLLDWIHYRNMLGLMVKIGDERGGGVSIDERISKPLTARDRQRLDRGASMARKVLIKAGCREDSIVIGPVRGAHPGSTARLGEVVDENLQTKIPGLYVCDASVLPEALDQPVVLTLIALAKRLADHLVPTGNT